MIEPPIPEPAPAVAVEDPDEADELAPPTPDPPPDAPTPRDRPEVAYETRGSMYKEIETEDLPDRGRRRLGRPDGFFGQLSQYPRADWEHLKLYLYRLAPVTDRLAGGHQSKYITTYTQPIDEQTILTEHGSGKYRFLLNLIGEKNQSRSIKCVEFEIENPKYPPNVPGTEWMDDKRNDRWNWGKPKDAKTEAPPPGPVVPVSTGPSLGEIMEAARTMHELSRDSHTPGLTGKDIAEIIGKTQQVNDPNTILEQTKAVLEMVKPAPAPAPDNTTLTFVMSELKTAREENGRLLDKLLDKIGQPPPAPPAPGPLLDPMDQMIKTFKALGDAKEALGLTHAEGGSSNMSGWQEFLKEPLTQLLNLAQPFAQVGAALMGAKLAGTAGPGIMPNLPATTGPQATGQPAPAAAQTPPAGQPPAPPDPTQVILNATLGFVDPTLRAYFTEGLSGADFAAWFSDTAIPLPPPYNLISESITGADALRKAREYTATGPQGAAIPAPEAALQMILGAYKGSPQIWSKIAPGPEQERKFSGFIREFLAYNPDRGAKEENAAA
jgi:hypothetical protein